MPAWLLAPLKWIGQLLFAELADFVRQKIEERRKRKAAEDEAKASVDPLKKAQTGKEIDDAARDSADGI
jgi:hypothetical protein